MVGSTGKRSTSEYRGIEARGRDQRDGRNDRRRIRRSVQKKAWTIVRPRMASGALHPRPGPDSRLKEPDHEARKSGIVQTKVAHRAGAG